mgnify:FL=1
MEEYQVLPSNPNPKKVMDIEEFRKEYDLGKQAAYNYL